MAMEHEPTPGELSNILSIDTEDYIRVVRIIMEMAAEDYSCFKQLGFPQVLDEAMPDDPRSYHTRLQEHMFRLEDMNGKG